MTLQMLTTFLLCFLTFTLYTASTAQTQAFVDFSKQTIGAAYCRANTDQDFGNILWKSPDCARGSIQSSSGNKVLRIDYPKGGVGPDTSGIQFQQRVTGGGKYELTYDVTFRDGFAFVKGGKLPGMCGGKCYTGGSAAEARTNCDGWSTRYMWREDGKGVAYVYSCGSPSETYAEDIPMMSGGTQLKFKVGTKYTLKQRIEVNSGRNRDGILKVWVNGQVVIDRKNMLYAQAGTAPVDKFYFSTFFGGSGQDWAPPYNVQADYDNFNIVKV